MVRRYFLIDYENTNGSGLRGVKLLSSSDIVYVYYTTICRNINMEFIENFPGRFVCKKVPSGDQSVDKHIIAKMGQLSAKENIQIVIISKDKGYNPIIRDIDQEKHRIVRHSSIADYLQLPDTEDNYNNVIKQTEKAVQVIVDAVESKKPKKKKKKKKDKKISKLSSQKRSQLNAELNKSLSTYKKIKKIEIDSGWMLKNIFKHLNDEKPFTTIPNTLKSKGKVYEEVYLQIIEPILLEI